MALKKINAVASWILIALLLVHIFTTLAYLLTGWVNMDIMMKAPRALAIVCVIHVCISLAIVFFMHDGSDFTRYGKLNQRTFMQRLSGLLILLLVHPHVKLFAGFIYENLPLNPGRKIFIFIVEMLFFGAIYTHLECSFSRSLITMGLIRSEKAERAVDWAARALCALGFAVTFFALARFLIMWDPA